MLDIQALEQNRRAKKHAWRQALRDQASEDLPKEGHRATRPPTASTTSAPASSSTHASIVPAAATVPSTSSSQPRKRVAALTSREAQPPPTRRRHLVDEPSDEDVEILGAQEDLQALWQNDNFVMPENRKDCFLLAKKIGVVDSLEKIDIFAREGPKVLAGRGILQRVARMDKGSEFMSLG